MKKSIIKRMACIFSAFCMTASLAACNRDAEPPLASKDHVFKAEELEIPVELTNINFIQSDGENIYIYGTIDDNSTDTDENGTEIYSWSSTAKLVIMDINGSLKKDITLSETSSSSNETIQVNKYVQGATIDNSGNLYMLEITNTYNNTTYESNEEYSLSVINGNGETIKTIDLTFLKEESNDEYFYLSGFTVDNAGNIYITNSSGIYVIDGNGSLIFTIEGEQQSDTSGEYINRISRTEDGRIIAYGSKWEMTNNEYKTVSFFNEIDINAKGYGKTNETTKVFNDIADGKNGHDLILVSDTALRGYDIETDTYSTVIDWLQSGFDTNTMQSPMILTDGRIICATYDYTSTGNGYSYSNADIKLSLLTKVAPADVPDKKLIKIVCWYLDFDLKRLATEFNKTNEQYQIEIVSYMEETGYDNAVTKLNNDLIAGNIPDILVMNNSMPVDNYIAKGLLADLYTFIDEDAEISREDFVPSILEAYSVNGKLYSMITSFNISTVVGKTSLVGEESGWTMDDFRSIASANPDKQMFSMLTKSDFINNALNMSLDDFINRETGECSFNTPEFISLLEYANESFPDEIDYEAYYNSGRDIYTEQQAQYRTGDVLLAQQWLSRFVAIKEMEQGQFGEPITFIGFPSSEGNGSSISASYEFAIMSKAKNPQGAWEFLRYYFTPEYQDIMEYQFPVINSAMKLQMDKAKEKPYYMDGEEKVEYENTYWMNNNESITLEVNTDADNQKVLDFISSVKTPQRYDQELTNIINEETGSYFSGQKKAGEVAEIIQNRVSVYVNEGR